jgi:hypothetical protein
MHRGLGITWNPLGITRPYSKLIVRGALIPAPAHTKGLQDALAPSLHDPLAPSPHGELAPCRPIRLRRRPGARMGRRSPSR